MTDQTMPGRIGRFLLGGIAGVVLAVTAAAAGAEDTRYKPWAPQSGPGGSGGDTTALVRELDALIKQAETARAADPRFLEDLKALARRYAAPGAAPRASALLSDRFADGDYTRNPTWTVSGGQFSIGRNGGLRSVVKARRRTASGDLQAAESILGSILNQGRRSGQATPQYDPGEAAVISAPVDSLPNAFVIEVALSALPLSGEGAGQTGSPHFEIGVFQGRSLVTGYRVIYEPDSKPALMLVRGNARGSSVIDLADVQLNAVDGRPRTLRITRDKAGLMTVSVDGAEKIRASDRAFRDRFAGIVLENEAGDFEIKSVMVDRLP